PRPLRAFPEQAIAGCRCAAVDGAGHAALRGGGPGLDGDAAPPRARTDAGARADAGSEAMRIGLGWHIRRASDRDIVWHNGGTGGYATFLGLDPVQRRAVVGRSNSSANVTDLGFYPMDPRFPLEPARASGGA